MTRERGTWGEMKIAITPRFYETKENRFIVVEEKYYPFMKKWGHEINLIPFMGKNISDYLDELKPEVVVFAGGYDYYTKEIGKFETDVLEQSLKRKLPILGICCGMWTINYYFGGSLVFDESHQCMTETGIDMKKWTHPVTVTSLPKPGEYKVNSFHSKVVDKLGEGLTPFVRAHDGTVEGFYNLEKRIMGVQFHMENKGVSGGLTKQIMAKLTQL
jgi:putative glutamine amidotransferase